ncbi:hypothetical protein LNN38_19930 [Pseudomonas sp. LA21]|uniref:hypothetical protein n=1 Tax=unclassified Pseudomonas TaxID=196821 RepID=UPI001FB67C6E|nr:hypothetical protein [Pseudomonas sp. LA21]MCJ1887141.1 hypothetical protein [Pseudomonas sp. LA21]
MRRFIAVLLAGVLAFALGGSSCSGQGQPSEHNVAPPPKPQMSDEINIGYQGIAPQQVQAIPRR